MLKNFGREPIARTKEFIEIDRLTPLNPLNQGEVGGREQADVVGILTVDAFEALGDHQSNPGRILGQGAVFARGPLAVTCPGDGHREAALANGILTDRTVFARLEADIGEAADFPVKVNQNRKRRDLVGRYIVA